MAAAFPNKPTNRPTQLRAAILLSPLESDQCLRLSDTVAKDFLLGFLEHAYSAPMACALGLQPAHSASRNGVRVQFHSATLLACKSWRSCGPHCERQRDRQSAWRSRFVDCPNCRHQAAAENLAGYRYVRDRDCGLHLLPPHRRLARGS